MWRSQKRIRSRHDRREGAFDIWRLYFDSFTSWGECFFVLFCSFAWFQNLSLFPSHTGKLRFTGSWDYQQKHDRTNTTYIRRSSATNLHAHASRFVSTFYQFASISKSRTTAHTKPQRKCCLTHHHHPRDPQQQQLWFSFSIFISLHSLVFVFNQMFFGSFSTHWYILISHLSFYSVVSIVDVFTLTLLSSHMLLTGGPNIVVDFVDPLDYSLAYGPPRLSPLKLSLSFRISFALSAPIQYSYLRYKNPPFSCFVPSCL